jgi:hypothetical protein
VKTRLQAKELREACDDTHLEMETLEIEDIVGEAMRRGVDEPAVLLVNRIRLGTLGGVRLEDLVQSTQKVLVNGLRGHGR